MTPLTFREDTPCVTQRALFSDSLTSNAIPVPYTAASFGRNLALNDVKHSTEEHTILARTARLLLSKQSYLVSFICRISGLVGGHLPCFHGQCKRFVTAITHLSRCSISDSVWPVKRVPPAPTKKNRRFLFYDPGR